MLPRVEVQVICAVVFFLNVSSVMDGAKKTGISWGAIVFLVLGALMLAVGLRILYKNGVLEMLDFMVVPCFAYLLINNYLLPQRECWPTRRPRSPPYPNPSSNPPHERDCHLWDLVRLCPLFLL